MTNIFDSSRRHNVKVEFDNGDTIKTEINGTPDEIVAYYIGKPHNLGRTDDNIAIGRKIWFFDGEQYLQHKAQMLYHGNHGAVIDHGNPKGLEVYSRGANGSKWLVDARREQLLQLGLGMSGAYWINVIKRES